MRISVDIPEEELEEVIRLTGASTKEQAILVAIRDFSQRQRLASASKMLGTFEDFMAIEELESQRQSS